MATWTRTRRLTVDDLIADRYPEIEFDLTGEQSVQVELSYDRSVATIDLGCTGADGWRGWSGGARNGFVIAAEGATPGYLPGPLEPGRWAVVLGLYRIPDTGVEVTVTITAPAGRPPELEPDGQAEELGTRLAGAPRGSARQLPAGDGLTWFAGDFHAHSVHSDGDRTLAELAALAVGAGLDFLAVTEHNTTSHHRLLPGIGDALDLALLPGQEVTTDRGHANAFGDIGFVDFRSPAADWDATVAARGGLLSLNHPLAADCGWQHPLRSTPQALEFWHTSWFEDLHDTGAWSMLSRDRPAVLLGGSDFHNLGEGHPPGRPTTWVCAEERTPEALLAATMAGRTAISVGAAPGRPVLVRTDDRLTAIDADGHLLTDLDGRTQRVRGRRAEFAATGQGPWRLTTPDLQLAAVAG